MAGTVREEKHYRGSISSNGDVWCADGIPSSLVPKKSRLRLELMWKRVQCHEEREDPRARWGANERIGATGKAQDTPQKKSGTYACQTKELPDCDSDRFLENRQVNHSRGHFAFGKAEPLML